jgi:hypothetical protein
MKLSAANGDRSYLADLVALLAYAYRIIPALRITNLLTPWSIMSWASRNRLSSRGSCLRTKTTSSTTTNADSVSTIVGKSLLDTS